MLTGTVTSEFEAVLTIELQGADGESETLRAAVDTGFDGFLALPSSVMTRLGLPFQGLADLMLADGSAVILAVFEATVIWHGRAVSVSAIEGEGGALVGMRLLQGSRLTTDVLENGPVRIEPIEQAAGD